MEEGTSQPALLVFIGFVNISPYDKLPTVPLVDNKEFRSIKNIIIKAVMELPQDVEIAHSEAPKEDNDEETIRPLPRFYKEEPALRIPTAPDIPPVVNHHKEAVPHNTMAVTKGIIGTLARLIGGKCMAHRQTLQGQIDHRLKQQINEKKLAMGLKIENTQKASYQTEETYEMSM